MYNCYPPAITGQGWDHAVTGYTASQRLVLALRRDIGRVELQRGGNGRFVQPWETGDSSPWKLNKNMENPTKHGD